VGGSACNWPQARQHNVYPMSVALLFPETPSVTNFLLDSTTGIMQPANAPMASQLNGVVTYIRKPYCTTGRLAVTGTAAKRNNPLAVSITVRIFRQAYQRRLAHAHATCCTRDNQICPV